MTSGFSFTTPSHKADCSTGQARGGIIRLPPAANLLQAGAMIEVCSMPTIDQDPGGDFQLCFWVLDAFNDETPFRGMIAEAAFALGRDPREHLQLPAYQEDEDFIEGALVLETTSIKVYFEHARSYLSLSNGDKLVLEEVLKRLTPVLLVKR